MSDVIHLVREVSEERKSRKRKGGSVKVTIRHIRTKCGTEMDPEVEGELIGAMVNFGATVWACEVTCPECAL
jgi:hypothetical protein